MRKRKRINKWQAEDDVKMKSLVIKHGIPVNLRRKSGVLLRCSPPVKRSGVQASLGAFFIKVYLGQNVR